MNNYEAKREARIERLHERAERAQAQGEAKLRAERGILNVIPLGQPILVGHHSERRHRRDLARAEAHRRSGMAALDAAKDLERRAQAAEQSTAVSSDDPAAVEKLRAKLDKIEEARELSKRINRAVRSPDPRAALAALGLQPSTIDGLLTPDFCGRLGVPGYRLTNMGAEARRIKVRIAALEVQSVAPPCEPLIFGDIRVEEADNRCRIHFPAKPADEVRAELKAAGFRWSPTEGAWQRMAGNQAWWWAARIATRAASAACACHRGSTCDVNHDPAACSCGQCVTAESAAAGGAR